MQPVIVPLGFQTALGCCTAGAEEGAWAAGRCGAFYGVRFSETTVYVWAYEYSEQGTCEVKVLDSSRPWSESDKKILY